jgi:glutathione S-transferase
VKITVYGDGLSGNCYKVTLLLNVLGIEHEWKHVDVVAGETRSEKFTTLNSARQIPVVELDDGTVLTQSNAILWYFARDTEHLPDQTLAQTRVLEWMFFEQYSHEPVIATARFWLKYLNAEEEYREKLDENRPKGYRALTVMEEHLAGHDWLVGTTPTIADMSLYAYTHVADEGGYDLDGYPAVRAWLARFATRDGHVAMAR